MFGEKSQEKLCIRETKVERKKNRKRASPTEQKVVCLVEKCHFFPPSNSYFIRSCRVKNGYNCVRLNEAFYRIIEKTHRQWTRSLRKTPSPHTYIHMWTHTYIYLLQLVLLQGPRFILWHWHPTRFLNYVEHPPQEWCDKMKVTTC